MKKKTAVQRQHFYQAGAISLWMTSLIMMLITLVGMAVLYQWRYGHWPMQDKLDQWGKSATVISNEVKNVSGVAAEAVGAPRAVTVDEGIRRCVINGKQVFSDTECSDSNATTRKLKLHDNKGFEPPKPPPKPDENAETLQEKMLNKALK